jgi:hypothetical protein
MTEEERIAHCTQLQWAAQQNYKPAYAKLGSIPAHAEHPKEPWGELRLTWVAGRLSGFEPWIKGEAFWRGLDIRIDVDKGWLQYQYRIKMDGPKSKITEMEKFLQAVLGGRRTSK